MLVRKEYLNILKKQRAPPHAAVPSLWYEGWLVSLATVCIYSALVYLATVLFLHRDSWLSWHLLGCLVPTYCCCWLVTSLLSSSPQKWGWVEERTLWNQKLWNHFWNPALSIWHHSEFRAHPLSSLLVTAQIWSPVCVCVWVTTLPRKRLFYSRLFLYWGARKLLSSIQDFFGMFSTVRHCSWPLGCVGQVLSAESHHCHIWTHDSFLFYWVGKFGVRCVTPCF